MSSIPFLNTNNALLDLFRAEVSKQIETFTGGIRLLLQGNRDSANLDALLRAAHSLKGAARMIEVDAVIQLAHVLEEGLLHATKQGGISEGIINHWLDAIATIHQISALDLESMGLWHRRHHQDLERIKNAILNPQVGIGSDNSVSHDFNFLEYSVSGEDRLLGIATETLFSQYRSNQALDSLLELSPCYQTLLDEIDALVNDHSRQDILRLLHLKERALLLRERFRNRILEMQELSQLNNHLTYQLHRELSLTRMQPFAQAVAFLPKITADLAAQLGKKGILSLAGTTVLVDRELMEPLHLLLLQLVQNAVDHGIEPPQERIKFNKPSEGKITITARTHKDSLFVSVEDDGRGIVLEKLREQALLTGLLRRDVLEKVDKEILEQLIFLPGITTSPSPNSISGRGIGLNSVLTTVQALGGSVNVYTTEGKGCRFELRLPLSLAKKKVGFFRCGQFVYGITSDSITDRCELNPEYIREAKECQYYSFQGREVPLADLRTLLDPSSVSFDERRERVFLVIINSRGMEVAFAVDELLNDESVLIQKIARDTKQPYVMAAALHNAGSRTSLILDPNSLCDEYSNSRHSGSLVPVRVRTRRASPRFNALLIETSPTGRELQSRVLRSRGFHVDISDSAEHAVQKLLEQRYDLIITGADLSNNESDVLYETIRSKENTQKTPILMLSDTTQKMIKSWMNRDGYFDHINKNHLSINEFSRAIERVKNRIRCAPP